MRNMSFILTTPQMYNKTKTQTSRIGWEFLKPGDVVMACEQCQGLKNGKKIVKIGPIKIIKNESVKVLVKYYSEQNITAEGFSGMQPIDFIQNILIKKCGRELGQSINRIKFEHLYDCYENCICYNCPMFRKFVRTGRQPDCACEDSPLFCEDQCYMCKYQGKCEVFLKQKLYWNYLKCLDCKKSFCETREIIKKWR